MKNIEYKIGKIEGEMPHICIVSLEDNALVFYANTWIREDLEFISFKDVFEKMIEKYNLKSDQVMCSGWVHAKSILFPSLEDPQLLTFNVSPRKYVPEEILEKFSEQLLSAYQKIDGDLGMIKFKWRKSK